MLSPFGTSVEYHCTLRNYYNYLTGDPSQSFYVYPKSARGFIFRATFVQGKNYIKLSLKQHAEY